jgi:hypothetical protein
MSGVWLFNKLHWLVMAYALAGSHYVAARRRATKSRESQVWSLESKRPARSAALRLPASDSRLQTPDSRL